MRYELSDLTKRVDYLEQRMEKLEFIVVNLAAKIRNKKGGGSENT